MKANGTDKERYDGKKLTLTGSTTRLEKNWQSNVFSEPLIEKPTRRLLGK